MRNPFKVLLIYPALFMQTGLPIGIASLLGRLKKEGIDVKIFDTVFYQEPGHIDENLERVSALHFKSVDYKTLGISKKKTNMLKDFTGQILEYKPNLIGLSSVECVFDRGLKLLRQAKKLINVPIIAGGIFPTLAPDIVIQEDVVDMVCIGEGEEAIVELCKYLQDGRDFSKIKNLWVKKEGRIIKNNPRPLRSLDLVTEPDFSHFNSNMFYRPMQGNLFKTIPIEFARGCPYQCTFCAGPVLNRLYRKERKQSYFRAKAIPNVIFEMEKNIKKYSPDFFYFASETFLAMSEERFDEFIKSYKNIKIPFWIQTRIETISYERIRQLKEVGLFWLTIGIEHGNEEFRREYLKRKTTNKQILKAVKILNKCEQGASLNNIIGFPFETRELIFDTIALNRELFQINKRIRCNVSIFVPFRGCELYDLCISNNLFKPAPYTNNTNIIGGSLLRFDSLSKEELNGIFKTFNLYVHLSNKYINRIKLAEQFTPEGAREFAVLSRKVNEHLDTILIR